MHRGCVCAGAALQQPKHEEKWLVPTTQHRHRTRLERGFCGLAPQLDALCAPQTASSSLVSPRRNPVCILLSPLGDVNQIKSGGGGHSWESHFKSALEMRSETPSAPKEGPGLPGGLQRPPSGGSERCNTAPDQPLQKADLETS